MSGPWDNIKTEEPAEAKPLTISMSKVYSRLGFQLFYMAVIGFIILPLTFTLPLWSMITMVVFCGLVGGSAAGNVLMLLGVLIARKELEDQLNGRTD